MDTLFDCDFSEDGKDEDGNPADVAIFGCDYDSGAGARGGQREGPFSIRHHGTYMEGDMWSQTRHLFVQDHLSVVDGGDTGLGFSHRYNLNQTYSMAKALLKHADVLGVMGGDHSLMYPASRAVYEKTNEDLVLVHFDAHPDFWEGDKEGDEHLSHASPVRRMQEDGIVSKVFHVGTRSPGPTPDEYEWARQHGSEVYYMDDVMDQGIGAVVDDIVRKIGPRKPVYVSVDVDVLDPAYAPGTGTPEAGGMQSREMIRALRDLVPAINLRGFDVVEVVPSYDHAHITSIVAHRMIHEVLAGLAWVKKMTEERQDG